MASDVDTTKCVACGEAYIPGRICTSSYALAYCTDQPVVSREVPAYQEVASDTPIISRNRRDCDRMTHPQILVALIDEAEAEGYEPSDLNHAGLPNIYLRERFRQEVGENGEPGSSEHVEDLFVMNVRQKTQQ